jgi:CRP-like cAMP-binding protein
MNDSPPPPAARQFKLDQVNNYHQLTQHLNKHHGSFVNKLTPPQLEDICVHGDVREYAQGQTIFFQGEISHEWFFVLDGHVSIYVHTSSDSKAFESSNQRGVDEEKKEKTTHKEDRHDATATRRRHCQGEVLKLGQNGIFIEALPESFKYNVHATKSERAQLGTHVATMEGGSSFGQVGILNKSPRSATSLSEGCLLLCLSKPVYDRTVRTLHIDTPQSIDKKVQLLRFSYLFAQWPTLQLEKLAFSTDLLQIKCKESVYDVGERASCLYIVMSGLVECKAILPCVESKIKKNRKKKISKPKTRGGNTIKAHLEICGPLSLLGLESVTNNGTSNPGNGRKTGDELFPCYQCSCPAIYDSKILRIQVSHLMYVIRSMNKDKQDLLERVTPSNKQNNTKKTVVTTMDKAHEKKQQGLTAIFNTIPLLSLYHSRRLNWWGMRREFHQVYFDVSVVLTMPTQCRHYQQVCGRCGSMHRNALRCKLFSNSEKLNEVLQRVTGIEHIMNREVEEYVGESSAVVSRSTLSLPNNASTGNKTRMKQIGSATTNDNEQLGKEEQHDRRNILLAQAAARELKRNSTNSLAGAVPMHPMHPMHPMYPQHPITESPYMAMPAALQSLRDKRRKPVWDTLRSSRARHLGDGGKKIIAQCPLNDEQDIEEAPQTLITSELRAVLSMKSRGSKAPLNSMLIAAYPEYKKNHSRNHAGKPR